MDVCGGRWHARTQKKDTSALDRNRRARLLVLLAYAGRTTPVIVVLVFNILKIIEAGEGMAGGQLGWA